MQNDTPPPQKRHQRGARRASERASAAAGHSLPAVVELAAVAGVAPHAQVTRRSRRRQTRHLQVGRRVAGVIFTAAGVERPEVLQDGTQH